MSADDAAEPCPTCGADEELFDDACGWCEGDARECACEGPDVCCGTPDDCEHFVCPWSDDDPDPEPGSWAWERRHGCMACGVCDACIEQSRAALEDELLERGELGRLRDLVAGGEP